MNENDIFIRNLKNLMKEHKLSQVALAKKLGMHQPTINQILNGKRIATMGFACKVCDAFDVELEQLFQLDKKQFGIKEDVQETNKDAIMQMQQNQLEQLKKENSYLRDEKEKLEEDNLRLEEEIEKLKKEISLYDLQQDNLQVMEMVDHPQHYNKGKYECIDEMLALFGVKTVMSFCKCNIYKYKSRAPYKNGEEDMRKAEWYMEKLLELMGRKHED